MATFLKRGNFSGSSGSHFFLDLYYDILSANAVRFYAYVGSVDGYSAGGSSSNVTINGTTVGSITGISARSNTLVGYLDVSGAGIINGTAACSTPWNGVGSASASGSVSVGQYITSFSVSARDETSVIYNWTASSAADYGWYSVDGTNWYDLPVNNIIGGLVPGQPYNFYLRLRQASTQAIYTSDAYVQSPYNYPYISYANNFTIGSPLNITLYNPLNRNCYVYITANGTQSGGLYTNTSTLATTFNTSDWVNWFYSTIPNQKQAQFSMTLYVSDFARTTAVPGGTYSITGNEKPVVTTTAIDTGKTLSGNDNTLKTTDLTGNNKKIIKYISNVKVDVTATAQNSSTLTSTTTKCGNQSAISGASHTYNNVETATFTGYATDSRSLSTGVTASGLTLINYIKLTLENLELYRDNQTSNTLKCKGGGNYFTGSFGNANNSLVFQLRYKEKSSSTWGSWETKTMTIGTNAYSFDFTVGTSFDYTKTYDFQFSIADKCMTVTASEVAKAGLPIQGLFEEFHEAFGVKTFEKTTDGIKLNNSILQKVVWTNSNISSSFAAQTIPITESFSDYSYYSIIYTAKNGYASTGLIPIDSGTTLQVCNYLSAQAQIAYRKVDISNNGFAFGDAYTNSTSNGSAKPYKIILYK